MCEYERLYRQISHQCYIYCLLLSFIVASELEINKQSIKPKNLLVNSHATPPGGDSLIWAIQVCAAPKGMVFQPFWAQIGYRFQPFCRHFGHKQRINFCTLVFNSFFLLAEATSSSRPPSPIRALPSSTTTTLLSFAYTLYISLLLAH